MQNWDTALEDMSRLKEVIAARVRVRDDALRCHDRFFVTLSLHVTKEFIVGRVLA